MVWDFISEAWDSILETLVELPSLIGEFLGSMFENMGEFSLIGILLGAISAGLIFVLRNQMLKPFVQNMNPFQAMFWTIATYVACFVAGYLIGKHFENTG